MVAIGTDPLIICLHCHDFSSLLSGLKYTCGLQKKCEGITSGPSCSKPN